MNRGRTAGRQKSRYQAQHPICPPYGFGNNKVYAFTLARSDDGGKHSDDKGGHSEQH